MMNDLSKSKLLIIINGFLLLTLLIFASVHPVQSSGESQVVDGYYVSTDGDNGNPGTQSNPWKTIQFAVDQSEPGDTIYVRAGTYNESVALRKSGLEGKPITLAAYGDEAVTINGGDAPAITALTEQWNGTQYWVIEGFSLDSNAERTMELSIWGAFWSDHMIVRNNYIRGSAIVSGSYNLFEGNEVDGSQHKGNENGVQESQEVSHHNVYRNNHIHHFKSRGIWSLHRTHDSIFENNHIHHIESGEGYEQGIDLDGFGTVVWRHIIRGNYIHDVDAVPIALENTFDSIVENNILHDSRAGISNINYGGEVGEGWGTDKRCEVGGENNQYGDTDGDNDCRGAITGNIIRQNLIHNIYAKEGIALYHVGGVQLLGNTISVINGSGIYLSSAENCPQIEIQGNIITECYYGAINIQNADSLTRDSNNLIYQSRLRPDYSIGGNWYSLSEYQEITSKGQGSIAVNPWFLDSSRNDFHLMSYSQAIDAGVDIGLATDLDGRSRPQGSGYDLGAYEYSGYQQMIYLPFMLMGGGK
jgi:hypothetical protein